MNQPTTPNTFEDFLPLPKTPHVIDTYDHGARVTSQDGYTADQVRAAILADRARLAPAAPSGEAVAWMQDDRKQCTTAENKRWMESAGFGVWHEVAAKYTIPLYIHPAPSEIEAAVELPEKPEPYSFVVKGLRRYMFSADQLTTYATEAVLKDRASMKGNK